MELTKQQVYDMERALRQELHAVFEGSGATVRRRCAHADGAEITQDTIMVPYGEPAVYREKLNADRTRLAPHLQGAEVYVLGHMPFGFIIRVHVLGKQDLGHVLTPDANGRMRRELTLEKGDIAKVHFGSGLRMRHIQDNSEEGVRLKQMREQADKQAS